MTSFNFPNVFILYYQKHLKTFQINMCDVRYIDSGIIIRKLAKCSPIFSKDMH